MHFEFAEAPLPLSLRAGRALLWAQATLVAFGGVFIVLTAVLFGDASTIPFRGQSLSGGGALALGAVYLVAGGALAYLGVELGRRTWWARTVIVSVEVFLGVLLVFRSFEISLSVILNLALSTAVVALLFVPDTAAAAGPRAATDAAGGTAGTDTR